LAAVTAVVLALVPFVMQQSSPALAADLAGLPAVALAAVAEVPAGLQPMAVATAGLLAHAVAISGVQLEAAPFAAVFVLAAAEADVPFADLWASQASAADAANVHASRAAASMRSDFMSRPPGRL
jgi:hypothetical protein